MFLSKTNIKNYRCFNEITFEPQPRLNIIVGENGSGKSSLFIGIGNLLTHLENANSQLNELDCRDRTYPLEISCEFTLTEQEKRMLLEVILAHAPTPQNQSELAYLRLDSQLPSTIIGVFEWDKNPFSYLKWGPMYISGRLVSSSKSRQGRTNHFTNLTSNERFLTGSSKLSEILQEYDLWETSGSTQQSIASLLSKRLRSFAEFRGRPSTTNRTAATESFQGNDTANVLLNLKNSRHRGERDKYAQICSAFTNFFPSLKIEAIQSEHGPSGSADVQQLEEGRQVPIKLDNTGAGIVETLTILTNLLGRAEQIIIIEEPENHLHPHLKRKLLHLVRLSSAENQIFVITHDPYFVDPDCLDSLARFFITKPGTKIANIATASFSERDLGQLQTALKDTTKREIVFAQCILLVEDESQKNIISGFGKTLAMN